MREKEFALADGSLYYETEAEGVRITRYNGLASEVVVPDQIEGCPVVSIGKKAFLSKKHLRRVVLPMGTGQIGEWAFAFCSSLTEVCLPVQPVAFGRAVFLDCGRLERISPLPEARADCFQPELLACALTTFDAYYLAQLPQVGSAEWLANWDAKLGTILQTPDQAGYSRQVLCGEEDYGSTDLNAYMSRNRAGKVRLAFLRLLHPAGLSEGLEEELKQYLRGHTKGCESEETWTVCRKEFGDRKEYYSLFSDLGCINSDNLSGILEDIGDEYPEMKAYFLKKNAQGADSFFDSLEL